MIATPPAPEPITGWAAGGDGTALWLNATAVAIDGKGIVILGTPGSGKSSLALNLLALGAMLIADDGLWLHPDRNPPLLCRPDTSPDLIEARGIGLIRAGSVAASAPLSLAVDLDRPEPHRLPPRRLVAVGTALCPLILGAGQPSLAAPLMLTARQGRADA